jgi:HAD superfamily hydrolase (TIGR01662 family)
MIRAVLLDLDETLIHYPQGQRAFTQAYLQTIEAFFAAQGLDGMGDLLLAGVRASNQNVDPSQANDAPYWGGIAQRYGAEQIPTVQILLDQFYAEVYPTLQAWVQPIASAAPLIETLLERGLMVIIATNPLYPLAAIQGRMTWGELDPHLDYARITHAHNSHFTKPHPHYFAEILAHLGCDPDEALMVGDDWGNDMEGASQAGLHTYYLPIHQPARPGIALAGQGTLADFLACVQGGWLDDLPSLPPQPAHIPPRLLGNLGAFFSTLADIPAHYWHQHPDPREWSPMEVVHHLYQYEKNIQRQQLALIARQENPFLRPPKLPPQPYELDLAGEDGMALAHQFAAERQKTLAFLAELAPSDWERTARHSIYGPTSLLEMTVLASRHDHLHIRQLCQTIGRCE